MKKEIKGVLLTVWSNGEDLESPATLNEKTGEITVLQTHDGKDRGCLEREKFTDEDENDYDVCPSCHEYILKTVMAQNKHCSAVVDESQVCMNRDCDYND